MIYAYPEYYKDFACIAGDCRHSCCIGWEIDIDEATAEKYRCCGGVLGERMQRGIDWQTDPPHFILGEGERCPFLNERGLCDIILEKGEDAISQICADHPRFRSFMEDREEIGLGLCCEEAARLILSREEPFRLIEEGIGEYSVDEDALLDIRDAAFELIDDRSADILQRMDSLLELCGGEMPSCSLSDWAVFYLELERLDEGWTACLESLRDAEIDAAALQSFISLHQRECRNLLNYFVFRHFFAALDDGDIASKAAFAVLSTRLIMALACIGADSIAECARMYSTEIEYSDENLYAIWDELSDI